MYGEPFLHLLTHVITVVAAAVSILWMNSSLWLAFHSFFFHIQLHYSYFIRQWCWEILHCLLDLVLFVGGIFASNISNWQYSANVADVLFLNFNFFFHSLHTHMLTKAKHENRLRHLSGYEFIWFLDSVLAQNGDDQISLECISRLRLLILFI